MQQTIAGATNLYALDIETECAVHGCPGEGGHDKCEHALSPFTARITQIAVTNGMHEEVFTESVDLADWVAANPQATFTAHNGKFDFKFLAYNGVDLTEKWVHDSSMLAFVCPDKIPDTWLEEYEVERQLHNKMRTGHKHRTAKHHSLKTLAPYFLGVKAFWEPEQGTNDREYVLTDARYTLQLTYYFLERMTSKALQFYTTHFMPWAKALLAMERVGIRLDIPALKAAWAAAEAEEIKLDAELRHEWREHFSAYKDIQIIEVKNKYKEMVERAVVGKKDVQKTRDRYRTLEEKAIAKLPELNLDSPQQLLWLIDERLGLNAKNWLGEDSADKETLTRLAEEEPTLKKLVQRRKLKKLTTAFYPEYMDMQVNSRIHTTFNMTSARTGRLSSSSPNMQQCPGDLHKLFVADPIHTLITRDLSAIEPTVLAYYSEDPILCQLMLNGGDFHGTTAVAAFDLDCDSREVKKLHPNLRQVAKTIGLAVLYGAGANQVLYVLEKNEIEGASLALAKRIVERIRQQYAGVWQFKQQLDRELEAGATIHNLLGRPYKIPAATDVYMKGLNTLIQGSASDYMLSCLRTIYETGWITPLLVVHDELVVQVNSERVPEAVKVIERVMQHSIKLNTQFGDIPIRVEGKEGREWAK